MHRALSRILLTILFSSFVLSLFPIPIAEADPVETRYLRNALWDNKTYPSAYNVLTGNLAGGTLANLQASDNVYMSFGSASVGYVQIVEVEFIGSLTGHVPFVQVQFEAHESVLISSVEFAAYNWQTGAYETTGTMYASIGISTSDITRYLYNLLGNKGKYVSATGDWKVKVKARNAGTATAPAAAFTLYIDYLCFRSVCYQLGTTQTTTAGGNDAFVDGLQVGIRVWGIKADDTEVEITAGTPVATVTGSSVTTTLSATWNAPSTVQYAAFLVIVYRSASPMQTSDPYTGGLYLAFMTEDLNASLSAAKWTVYYAFWYSAFADETYFRFGTSTYNSRIENFVWTQAVAKQWHDISTLQFNLLTRQWTSIAIYNFSLITRTWNTIANWLLNLHVRAWNTITNWTFNMISRMWQNIAFWSFNLGRLWHDITQWVFNAIVQGWHNIVIWMFQLTTSVLSIPVLFIGILFLACILLLIFKIHQSE